MRTNNKLNLLLLILIIIHIVNSAQEIYDPIHLTNNVIQQSTLKESSIFSYYISRDLPDLAQGVITITYDESILRESYIKDIYCISYDYTGDLKLEELKEKIPTENPKNNVCLREPREQNKKYEHAYFKYTSMPYKKYRVILISLKFEVNESLSSYPSFNISVAQPSKFYSGSKLSVTVVNLNNDVPKVIYFQRDVYNTDPMVVLNYDKRPFTLYLGNITDDENKVLNTNKYYGDTFIIPYNEFKDVKFVAIKFFQIGTSNVNMTINFLNAAYIKDTREVNEFYFSIPNCDKFYYLFGMIKNDISENKNSFLYIEKLYGEFDVYYTNDYDKMMEEHIFYPSLTDVVKEDVIKMETKLDSLMFKCRTPGSITFSILNETTTILVKNYRNIININSNDSPILSFINSDSSKFKIQISSSLNDNSYKIAGQITDSQSNVYNFDFNSNLYYLQSDIVCNGTCTIKFNTISKKSLIFITILSNDDAPFKVQVNRQQISYKNIYFDLNSLTNDTINLKVSFSSLGNGFTYQVIKIKEKNEDLIRYIPKENFASSYVNETKIKDKKYDLQILNPQNLMYSDKDNNYYYLLITFNEHKNENAISSYDIEMKCKIKSDYNYEVLKEGDLGVITYQKGKIKNEILELEQNTDKNKFLIMVLKKCTTNVLGIKEKYYDDIVTSRYFTEGANELLVLEKFDYTGLVTQIEGIYGHNADQYTGLDVFYLYGDQAKYESIKTSLEYYKEKQNKNDLIKVSKISDTKRKITWAKIDKASHYEIYIVKYKSEFYTFIDNECALYANKDEKNIFVVKDTEVKGNEYSFEYGGKGKLALGLVAVVEEKEMKLRLNFVKHINFDEEKKEEEGNKIPVVWIVCGGCAGVILIVAIIIIVIVVKKRKLKKPDNLLYDNLKNLENIITTV